MIYPGPLKCEWPGFNRKVKELNIALAIYLLKLHDCQKARKATAPEACTET